ncbi:putative cysteine proteinase [Trichinella spiralis]|uniref:putative cysteine proteinase n=1 Tax=Trichinella spiralis TaxID=6334 RepID=UPI0001EFB5EB|nr:putative cysteine proteinase [Trichinella spiralis]
MNSTEFNDMISAYYRHSSINQCWQRQLEKFLSNGRLNEISQWKTKEWKILWTNQPVFKQLLSIYSKRTENEGKSSCPKQGNIAQDLENFHEYPHYHVKKKFYTQIPPIPGTGFKKSFNSAGLPVY